MIWGLFLWSGFHLNVFWIPSGGRWGIVISYANQANDAMDYGKMKLGEEGKLEPIEGS